ncbi:MAG: hypothetical protein V3T73_03820 [Dehalococcoidales bacterium]
MTIFIALLITVLTFAFVVYPLIRRRPPSVGSAEDGKLGELHSKRDTTYSMLKELEFDFQSGILTEEDYRELEAKYKSKAISVLKDIDDLKKGSQPEAEVEAAIERQVQQLRRGEDGFCTQCGARRRQDELSCSRCGAALSQGESVD